MKRLFRLPASRAGVRRDVADEVSFHLEGRIEEFVAQGMSREAAEREARRAVRADPLSALRSD